MTRDGECHDTTRGITQGVVIASTYIDSRQKSTGISYWAYGYTGNCITRVMTVLYFQLILYIAGIAIGIVRSQLLRRYIQPEPICQPSGRALLKTVYSTLI